MWKRRQSDSSKMSAASAFAAPALSLLLLIMLLVTSIRENYILLATFITYNNSLDSYETSENDTCCYSQRNCSERCNTILRYCFKEYGIPNNLSDDDNSADTCLEGALQVRAFSKPTEYINYSVPHRDILNKVIPSSLTYRGIEWPEQLQFFVRSAVGEEIVELNFQLNIGDPPLNATITGSFFPSYMTFTVSLSLSCISYYYGPNCSVYFIQPTSRSWDTTHATVTVLESVKRAMVWITVMKEKVLVPPTHVPHSLPKPLLHQEV